MKAKMILQYYSSGGIALAYYSFKPADFIFSMKNYALKEYHNNTHTACVGLLIVCFYRTLPLKNHLNNMEPKMRPFKIDTGIIPIKKGSIPVSSFYTQKSRVNYENTSGISQIKI